MTQLGHKPVTGPISQNRKSVRQVLAVWPRNDLSGEIWLGRQGSNLRMAIPKTAALPLGYAPTTGH